MKTKLVLLSVAAFSLSLCWPVKAADTTANDLEIILDCSGSMAQMIEGKSKINIAKESLNSVVNSIPDGSYVGFRAYGHRNAVGDKEGSCKDTELIFPIASVNKSEILNKINSLQAKGWTPIDYSLRQAKNDFPAEYGKRIILVSDGEETCGGDPCAAVKELINSGFKVQVDTVGFAVDSNTEKQLRCIAEASGGEYKSAKNARELTESLRVFSTRAFEGYKASGNVIPGLGFGDAPLVSPGIYGGNLLPDESKFYKFNVKSGQKVTISASIKKERAVKITESIMYGECTCIIPTITAYGADMSEVGKKTGDKYNDWEIKDPQGQHQQCIPAADITPKAYSFSYDVAKSGEDYISVSTGWLETCNTNDNQTARWKEEAINIEKEKPNIKAFYDVKITIEGAGIDEPATTTATSTSTTTKNTSDSNSGNSLPTPQDPQNSSSTKWIIIALAALILIIGGGFLFYFIKKRGANSAPEVSLGNNYPNPNVMPTPPAPPAENSSLPQSKDNFR